jgi:myo-inositol-1(or 4)-monophosphatase
MSASLLKAALAAARAAGAIILERGGLPRTARFKGRNDLVTETDLAVEAFLREELGKILPGVAFFGEESAGAPVPDGDCWIVDPVDGTTNFVHGLPFVATSIALRQGGDTLLGIVHLPVLDECFSAARGAGARLNDRPIRVSATRTRGDALIATGFPYDIGARKEDILLRLGAVLSECRGLRRCGAAAADLAYVAAGRFDAFYESGLKVWDYAAGGLLVEEAGGRVSRTDGLPLGFDDSLLASNGRIHRAMIELLNAANTRGECTKAGRG